MIQHEVSHSDHIGKPAYFVAYNKEKKEVYVVVKGTSNMDDCVTDILLKPGTTDALPIEGVLHTGMSTNHLLKCFISLSRMKQIGAIITLTLTPKHQHNNQY